MITEQVKRAKRQMKEAGFDSSEFRCRVQCHVHKGCREYGEAHVTVWNSSLIGKRCDAILASGLGVYHYKKGNIEFWLVMTGYESRGKLTSNREA